MDEDYNLILVPHHLDAVKTPLDKKNLVASSVIDEGESAAVIAHLCGYRPRTVSEWVARRKRGIILQEKGGRPPVLDEIAFQNLLAFYAENPGVADSVLREQVKLQLIESNERRSLMSTRPAKCVSFSDRSLKRYVAKIKKGLW